MGPATGESEAAAGSAGSEQRRDRRAALARRPRQATMAQGVRRSNAQQHSAARAGSGAQDTRDPADRARARAEGAARWRRSEEDDGRCAAAGAGQGRTQVTPDQAATRDIALAKQPARIARLEGSRWTP